MFLRGVEWTNQNLVEFVSTERTRRLRGGSQRYEREGPLRMREEMMSRSSLTCLSQPTGRENNVELISFTMREVEVRDAIYGRSQIGRILRIGNRGRKIKFPSLTKH